MSRTSAKAKELIEALYYLLLGLAPNIRTLELGPVFQDATQNVSLARLLQALPDDVSEFDVYDWAGSTDTLAIFIAPEIEKLANLEKLFLAIK